MRRQGIALVLLVATLSSVKGRSCYVGQSIAPAYTYNPTANFARLFNPTNLVSPPTTPTITSTNCETSGYTGVGSSHCVTYLSGLYKSYACSNPKTSSSNAIINNCTEGVTVAGATCCNSTDACNAPTVTSIPGATGSALTCKSTPGIANSLIKTSVPLSAGMIMSVINDTAAHARLAIADTAPPAAKIPPLDAGNLLQAAIDLKCDEQASMQGATKCVSMVVKNFMGVALSFPIYSCLSDSLVALGITSDTANTVITGDSIVEKVLTEALEWSYRTTALSADPPTTPSVPTLTDAQKTSVKANVPLLSGPSAIKYTTCTGNSCNTGPAASTGTCYSLLPGSLAAAKAEIDKGNTLGSLAKFRNGPTSCGAVPGHSTHCVTVKALGTPLFSGCYSDLLEGVSFPDLKGGALPVTCDTSKPGTSESATAPIPPQFFFGLTVPEGDVTFTCCKGDLCNTAAAPLVPTSAAVQADILIGGIVASGAASSTIVGAFIASVKDALETSLVKLAGVPADQVNVLAICVGEMSSTGCTWLIGNPPASTRRADAIDATGASVRVSVLAGGGKTQSDLQTAMSASDFAGKVLDELKSSVADSATSARLTVKVSGVTSVEGDIKPILQGSLGATGPRPLMSFTTCIVALASAFVASATVSQ